MKRQVPRRGKRWGTCLFFYSSSAERRIWPPSASRFTQTLFRTIDTSTAPLAAGAHPAACEPPPLPELTTLIYPALRKLVGRPVLLVNHHLEDRLVLVNYDRRGLGNDRVADAVAALAQYQPPLAIFGAVDKVAARRPAGLITVSLPKNARESTQDSLCFLVNLTVIFLGLPSGTTLLTAPSLT